MEVNTREVVSVLLTELLRGDIELDGEALRVTGEDGERVRCEVLLDLGDELRAVAVIAEEEEQDELVERLQFLPLKEHLPLP